MRLHLDLETYSEADLKKVGCWAYASHPSTDILCVGFAVDNGHVLCAPPTSKSVPLHAVELGARLVAHNVQFEYAIAYFVLHRRYGWPLLTDPARWDCTMARALTCGLPGSLEGAARALQTPFQKDSEGYAAMMKLCKPNKITGERCHDPKLLEQLYAYNMRDVETERALDHALPPMTPDERKVFELDLTINARGIGVDVETAKKASMISEKLTADLNVKLRRLTKGAVSKASGVPELKRWVVSQGVAIPTKEVKEFDEDGTEKAEVKETLDKEAIGDMLKDPTVPAHVKEVVAIRAQANKSSTKKYAAMALATCSDGRFRGAYQYYGAHTGRFAGRIIQVHNLPQGLKGAGQLEVVDLIKEGDPGLFGAVYGDDALKTLSNALRGMLVPTPGTVYVGADYNAIEARVLFWLAQEQEALDAYATGASPYIALAEKIYGIQGITQESHPTEYDIGKRSVLGAGYGMGWVRFKETVYTQTMQRTGIGVELPDDLAKRAIRSYREKYNKVVATWYAVQAAAVGAVLCPGRIFPCCAAKVLWAMAPDGQFLTCRLPSGRMLRYFRPSVHVEYERQVLHYWAATSEKAIKTDCNGKLGWFKSWGGKLVENVVQAIARDIMCCGMVTLAGLGYKIVLHTHDEIVAEVPEKYNPKAEEFAKQMCILPGWATGLPIAAKGFVAQRYRK